MNSGFPDHPNLPVRDSDTDDIRWALQTAIVQLRRGGVADAIVWVRRAADEAEAAGAGWRAQELRAQADYLAAHVWQPTPSQPAAPASEIPIELDAIEEVEADDLLEETGSLPSSAGHGVRTGAPPTLISSAPPLSNGHARAAAPPASGPPASSPKHAQTLLSTVPPLPDAAQPTPPPAPRTPSPRWNEPQPEAPGTFRARDPSPRNLAATASFRRPQASAPDLEIEEVNLEDVAMEEDRWEESRRVRPAAASTAPSAPEDARVASEAVELPLDDIGEATPELDDLFDEEEVVEDELDRLSELTLDPAEFEPEPAAVPRPARTGFEGEPLAARTSGAGSSSIPARRSSSRATVQPQSVPPWSAPQSGASQPPASDDARLFDASTLPPPQRGGARATDRATPSSASPAAASGRPGAPPSASQLASEAPPPSAPPDALDEGTEVDGVDLQVTRGFEDLPEEVQQVLAARARVEALEQGEEVGFFGAALVTHGSVDIVPAISEDPGALAHQGDVVFTKGTLRDGVALRVVAKMDDTRVATWSPEALEAAIADCPWVHDELRLIADYYLAVCGAALGPLGERLDDALRATVFQRLEVRAYRPGDVLAEPGKAVPGLFVLGGGRVELVNERGKVERELALGEFLFPSSILSATAVEATARAGQGGALMLFAPRGVAHELMMSVPPLLEVLAS